MATDKQVDGANLALSEERTKWQAEKEELVKQVQILSEQHRATAEDGRVSEYKPRKGTNITSHCSNLSVVKVSVVLLMKMIGE